MIHDLSELPRDRKYFLHISSWFLLLTKKLKCAKSSQFTIEVNFHNVEHDNLKIHTCVTWFGSSGDFVCPLRARTSISCNSWSRDVHSTCVSFANSSNEVQIYDNGGTKWEARNLKGRQFSFVQSSLVFQGIHCADKCFFLPLSS